MNYKRQYDLLMEKAIQRGTVEGYKERHHILPRCMGGGNEKENLVELTAREHYIAHRLLYMHHKTPKMAHAWNAMCRVSKNHNRIITSRQYERAKTAVSESLTGRTFSEETRRKMSEAGKRKTLTKEHRTKLANRPFFQSEEYRKKMSEALKGRVMTEEHRRKIGAAHKGRVYSEETIEKMRVAAKIRERNKNRKKTEPTPLDN